MSGIPDLTALADEAVAQISAASDLEALEAARVRFLGRKAPLTELLGSIGTLPPEERGRVGKDGNAARRAIEAAGTPSPVISAASRVVTRRRPETF